MGTGGWGRASNLIDTHFFLTATGDDAGSNRNDRPRLKGLIRPADARLASSTIPGTGVTAAVKHFSPSPDKE